VTRSGAVLILAGTLLLPMSSSSAQEWPTRPVRIVNTFAPGGTADILARMVADQFSTAFSQQFFVETRAGAGGVIGVQSVANAPPDGYNFAITTFSLLVIGPTTNPNIGYDPIKGLTNIAYIAGSPTVFVVNPSSGIRTLPEFVAHAKASEKPLTYGTSGVGSNGQLVVESFARKIGVKVEHVPYKGAAQSLMDLIGGHIVFAPPTLSSAAGQLRENLLTPLAHTAKERLPDYPSVPTFKELGYSDMVATTWFALAGPAKLPQSIMEKANREIVTLLAKPSVQTRLRETGLLTEVMTPGEFDKFIADEIVRWKPVIEQAGLIEK